MDEDVDIQALLRSWPFEPEKNVRVVKGRDGREILQIRLPLGIEQHELDGRPDGLRPHNADSALAFHLERLARARADGVAASFALSESDCAGLFAEGTLFYYRYLHLFQLHDWPRTVRDTARNIKLFDFVHRHASRREDRMHLEKWRPYIVRMNAAASALLELDRHRHDASLRILEAAIGQIEQLTDYEDETFQFERERSLRALREMADQVRQTRPLSDVERLQKELNRAIETQEFERAAEIRDILKALRVQDGPGSAG